MSNILWKLKSFEQLLTEDLYKIIKARIDVFVVEQNCPYSDCDDADQVALHLWAEENGKVVCYCRIFPENIKYAESSIGRVLTTEIGRGRNLGRQMMKYAVEAVENRLHTSKIRISAQDYLIPFYNEFGFIATDKKYLEDNLPHTEMFRE
ncbi:GNAT family N-acetyltransferase [Frigoriflavimonas asaccharolytica]|uniref:ElaA protein n=1 Tax=Frigoriflavimonas asaccharolytica TaxID=2735899 RepID=A0A8J8G4W1_9FLAO|nr:GNAT family N-acetyltransferase [Frigoriflavimonas asaccharolytica]NRS91116.1 ElaA protein [Frigoriflavimonas asaccharolytica]